MAYVRGDRADSLTIKTHLDGCDRCGSARDVLENTNVAPSGVGERVEAVSTVSIRAAPTLAGDGATGAWDAVGTEAGVNSGESGFARGVGPSEYKILGRLGSGGMGEVFKAHHIRLDRIVALKMIRRVNEKFLARFRAEARAVARLQHPNSNPWPTRGRSTACWVISPTVGATGPPPHDGTGKAVISSKPSCDVPPEMEEPRDNLTLALIQIGNMEREDGHFDDAIRTYDRALETLERLVQDNPKNPRYVVRLNGMTASLATSFERLGRRADAFAAFARSREAREPRPRARPRGADRPDPRPGNQTIAIRIAQIPAEAPNLDWYARARDILENAYVGYLGWRLGKFTAREAVARLDKALARVSKRLQNDHDILNAAARCHALRAVLGGVPESGRTLEDARADLRTAADLLRRAVATGHSAAEILADRSFAPLLSSLEAPLLRSDLVMPTNPFAPE